MNITYATQITVDDGIIANGATIKSIYGHSDASNLWGFAIDNGVVTDLGRLSTTKIACSGHQLIGTWSTALSDYRHPVLFEKK